MQYDEKLCGLLEGYDKCFVVHADNVGSRQFMDIRRVRSRVPLMPQLLDKKHPNWSTIMIR